MDLTIIKKNKRYVIAALLSLVNVVFVAGTTRIGILQAPYSYLGMFVGGFIGWIVLYLAYKEVKESVIDFSGKTKKGRKKETQK